MIRSLFLLGLLACSVEKPVVDFCDAGDEAWIQKVFPLVWGRKPHGAHEVRIWATVAQQHGRDAVIRAMTYDPEYRERWSDWIYDALAVSRTGDRVNPDCFAERLLDEEDGSLARHMRDNRPDEPYKSSFTMADVVHSGLIADDISVIWRANLYARMTTPIYGANVSFDQLEQERRIAFGDGFFETYLNRNLTCLPCHNSEYSVTGNDNPVQDRTWEIPGLYEKALLGSSYGIDKTAAYAMFRYYDLTDDAEVKPWGWDRDCGSFAEQETLNSDFLGHEGYFIEALGESGSVWDVEAALARGVEAAQDGIALGGDEVPEGDIAFASLVAQSIADQVWLEATGNRLTISNYFPRNPSQRNRLQEFSDLLLENHWSMRELLVAVTTDPFYNAAAPAVCDADPYEMPPLFNPWTISELDERKKNNGPGDQVHRHSARTLIRSVHDSLGWPQPELFPSEYQTIAKIQLRLGARMRDSQPGFNGTDFQGLLAFEDFYGSCEPPDMGGASPEEDIIDRLLVKAIEQHATVGDVAATLKDRLTSQSEFYIGEQQLIEKLLGEKFENTVSADIESNLRQWCGTLLLSPQYLMYMDLGDAGPIPALTIDKDQSCQKLQTLLAEIDISSDCT